MRVKKGPVPSHLLQLHLRNGSWHRAKHCHLCNLFWNNPTSQKNVYFSWTLSFLKLLSEKKSSKSTKASFLMLLENSVDITSWKNRKVKLPGILVIKPNKCGCYLLNPPELVKWKKTKALESGRPTWI